MAQKEEQEDIVKYVGPFGHGSESYTFWDEYEENFKDDILKNKIIKIKIYYQSDEDEKIDEKYIIGISLTYMNFFTGEIKEIEHKGTDNFTNYKEIIIKPGDYLKKFHINFKDDFDRISQIGFTTYNKNEIFVGIKDGLDKIIKENEDQRVIVGFYGYLGERLEGIGCLFVKKDKYIKSFLFRFFMIRYLIKKNEKFKNEWDDKYKELDKESQYVWKAMNSPDAIFAKIIGYCVC